MPNVNDYVQNLHEQRHKAWGEQKSIVDAAVTAGRELSAEERATVDRTDAALDSYDKEIRSWLDREAREKEAAEARSTWETVLRPEQIAQADTRSDSQEAEVLAFLRGERRHVDIDLRAAAREKALIRAGHDASDLRVLGRDTAAAGGTLVPTILARTLVDYMETINGIRVAGAEVITTTGGEPLAMPTVATGGTAALRGEGTAIGAVDPTFGQVVLYAWKYGQLVQVSTELVSDSGVDVISFVARDAGRALGRVTNTAYTVGSGSNQPTGLVTGSRAAGTGAVSQTGATGVPAYSDLISLIYSVGDEAYAGPDATFQTKWSNMAAIRKILDGDQRPLWQPSLIAGQPDTLLGYRVVSNPDLAAWGTAASTYTMLFGDVNMAYTIRDVGSVRFERSDDFAFDKDLITFRAVIRTDGKVMRPTACKVMAAPTT